MLLYSYKCQSCIAMPLDAHEFRSVHFIHTTSRAVNRHSSWVVREDLWMSVILALADVSPWVTRGVSLQTLELIQLLYRVPSSQGNITPCWGGEAAESFATRAEQIFSKLFPFLQVHRDSPGSVVMLACPEHTQL